MSRERGAVLLLAAGLIAFVAVTHLTFEIGAVLMLAALVAVLLFAFPGGEPPRWAVSIVALLSPIALLFFRMPDGHDGGVVPTPVLGVGIAVGVLTAVVVAVLPWLPANRVFVWGALALLAAGYALIILGGRPLIDVWIILRDSAGGLLHGRDPYEMAFPDVPAGQTDNCFNYLPATFLLTAPAQWFLGDVRWLESACLLGASALICWHVRDSRCVPPALLIGVLPGTLDMVQQSWTEPILLLGLVAGAVLIDRGRPNWAVLPLALALATKQHLVVLLPLLVFWPRFGWRRVLATGAVAAAVCLPWFVADPVRFRACTVDFFLSTPALQRSDSMWQLVPDPFKTVFVLVVVALAYWLVWRRAPRTGSGFLISTGVVLAAFDLVNKQTFMNQWVFAVELLVAGLALTPVISVTRTADAGSPFLPEK